MVRYEQKILEPVDGNAIPVFVISLSTAKERRKHIRKQLDRSGLDYSIVNAVNGKALTDSEIAAVCDMNAVNKNPQWLSSGAIGCALSHLNIYQKIVEEGLKWTLILEDDVILAADFKTHLDGIIKNLTTEDVVMLYYQSWEPLKLSNQKKILYWKEHGLYFPTDIRQVITTGAYLISHDAAKRLKENILPIRVSADSWGWFHAKGCIKQMRCVYPRIVETEPFKSSIDYFGSTVMSTLSAIINRVRFPVIYQVLRQRRIKNFKNRQRVQLTDQIPTWQEN